MARDSCSLSPTPVCKSFWESEPGRAVGTDSELSRQCGSARRARRSVAAKQSRWATPRVGPRVCATPSQHLMPLACDASAFCSAGKCQCKSEFMGDGLTCERFAYCGDNARQGSEQCDGLDLNGATCARFGFDAGTLVCSVSCTYEIDRCSNNQPAGMGGTTAGRGGTGGTGGTAGSAGAGGRPPMAGSSGSASLTDSRSPSSAAFDHYSKPEVAPGGYGSAVDRPPPHF